MEYRVDITVPAESDAYTAYEFLRRRTPASADRWLRGLFDAVYTLKSMPQRCSLIPEAMDLHRNVRHLLYRTGTSVHRIIFDIDDEAVDGPVVRILRIWHGARDRIRPDDLDLTDEG